MRKATKKWLIAAAFLVLLGVTIFVAVSACHWEFSDLDAEKFETNLYEIQEEFRSIEINTDTADILFVPSNDGTCSVVCYEEENRKHSVRVQDGTLTVSVADQRAWYDYIGFHFHSPKLTVKLPQAELASLRVAGSTGSVEIPKELSFESVEISVSTGDVSYFASATGAAAIGTSTGEIRVEGVSADRLALSAATGGITVSDTVCAGELKVSVTTGDVRLLDSACRDLSSDGSTGDILLKNVIAAGKISIGRSTGNVRFDGSDAAELSVTTGTGDVTGSLRTEKVFLTESSTGGISVPRTAAGGKCEITTSTGDIIIALADAEAADGK